ncbi:conserved hypothetical protein [Cupriavidus phytorum]|uniref:Uncharacterized protein n=1 Tax=Cupriavidus taiwanensis TaxID=164546 RepID=A0A375B9R3_9BURK|nr:conserved hypothetical protein [Cupriavidus taiwanensis]
MSIQQKMRLLANWLPAGLPHFTHGTTTYLHLKDVPYELESIIARWLILNPNFTEHDSQECVLMDHPDGLAISQEGWQEFVSWILKTLTDRLYAMEVKQCC